MEIRIYELAREMGASSREILDFLCSKGYKPKAVSSHVGEEEIKAVRDHFSSFEAKKGLDHLEHLLQNTVQPKFNQNRSNTLKKDDTQNRVVSNNIFSARKNKDQTENQEHEVTIEELGRKIKPCEMDRDFLFISYKREDWRKVYPIVIELQRHGANIWIDKALESKVGENWQTPAFQMIKKMTCVSIIFFASFNSYGSPAVLSELKYANKKAIRKRHRDQFKIMTYDIDNIISDHKSVNQFIKDRMREFDIENDQEELNKIFTDDLFDEGENREKYLKELETKFEIAGQIQALTDTDDDKTILADSVDKIIATCNENIMTLSK